MAKKKQYWAKRSEQRLTRVLADAEKTLNLLESQYKNASISINKDIKKLYSQFAGENNISMDKAMELIHGSEYLEWRMSMDEYLKLIDINNDQKLILELNTLAMRSRITRLEALNAEILANVAIMTERAEKNTSLLLIRSLENTYYESMYDEYKDRNPKVYDLMSKHNVGLSKAQIDRQLKIPWSGANYSTNLWNNADYIANKCQQLVAQNIIAGTSVDKLTQEITKKFGKNYRASARRLLLTETAYIKGQADKLTYEKLGIEEYEILATLDMRTSSICQNQDGKHYPIDDAVVGENYPPFHPNCRSTTVKYNPDIEDRTRIARDADGNNVNVPRNMKYKDWLEWVKSGQSIDEWLADNPGFNLSEKQGINKETLIKKIHEFDLSEATKDDIIELGRDFNELHDISSIIGDKEALKSVFSEYREMGGEVSKSGWAKGSKKIIKEQLSEAFSYYPKKWANYAEENGKKIYANKSKRGFFSRLYVTPTGKLSIPKEGKIEDHVSIYTDGRRKTTPYHEIGHYIEFFNPDVVRIEKEFINYRTKGEDEVRLSKLFPGWGYRSNEVTRPDDFISPYVGKAYDDAAEVLSIGLESIFEPGEGHIQKVDKGEYIYKTISDDIEFLELIIGLILKG